MMLYLDCPTCGQLCEAEVPPCADDHRGACPDRACVECGTALLIDPPLSTDRPARRGRLRPAA
ncbi:MAG TPA: hypothetical protein VGL39_12190 [Jatrophihabitantaceae bacterium]|jgi:hypothetical protein